MICPHCHSSIREEDEYVMARRLPKHEPLPPEMRRLGVIGLVIVGALVLGFLMHVARAHGIAV